MQKCGKQNTGETKGHLLQRFGEHRRSILNYGHFPNPTPVPEHFNQADHSINDVLLIPLELIRSNRDSDRKAREAHLIDKVMTLELRGMNRRDELRSISDIYLFSSLSFSVCYVFKSRICSVHLLSVFSFLL